MQSKGLMDQLDLIEMLPGHVYWVSPDGVMLGCNKHQADYYGLTPQNVIGKTLWDLHPKPEADSLFSVNRKVIECRRPVIAEEVVFAGSGEKQVYLSHKVPLKNPQGNIVGILGISFDITEMKEREWKKERLLEHIIAAMPGHVYWKDKRGAYLGCNQKQAESAGYSSSGEMIGKTDWDMPWKEQAAQLVKVDQQVLLNREKMTIEETSLLQNGKLATFISQKIPLTEPESNEVTGILGISMDITEQKASERLKQQLFEEKYKTISLLSATIAHEMRTPLGGINLLSQLIDENITHMSSCDLSGASSAQLINELNQLKTNANELKKIVAEANSFIDSLLSTIKDAQPENKMRLSIKAAVDEALNAYPSSQRAHVSIRVLEGPDFEFLGAQSTFNHILFNLLKNAIFYIRRANKGEIEIWMEQAEQYNFLHFKDTGTGISAEHLPKIFDQFFSKTIHGTGVGLAFIKMTLQNMGGDIQCDSVDGEYTHFRMSFPKVD